MNIHPSFRHHLPMQASVRKCDVNAIMQDKPITLPFIKREMTLWQRIKRLMR